MGARAMLCKGLLCALKALHKGHSVCDPPPAKLCGQEVGRQMLPPCQTSTGPQAKPTQEQSWKQRGQHSQECKRDLSGDAIPCTQCPKGHNTALGLYYKLQLISQGKCIFSPGANRNRHTGPQAAPASTAVLAEMLHGACPGGQSFASGHPAVYGVNTSMVWAAVAADTGELQGHCLSSPATSIQWEPL